MAVVVTLLISAGEPDPTWDFVARAGTRTSLQESLPLHRCPVSRLARRAGVPDTLVSWPAMVAANAGWFTEAGSAAVRMRALTTNVYSSNGCWKPDVTP